jgi:hypothetical protein
MVWLLMTNSKRTIYGVVFGNVLYTNRMSRKLRTEHSNGVYSIDMSSDDFELTLTPADLAAAVKDFRRSSNIRVIRGVSFKDGIIPVNPVAFNVIPLKVIDATYDDFEEIDVVHFDKDKYYFMQTVETQQVYSLLDLRNGLMEKPPKPIETYRGISPEARIAYLLQLTEWKMEEEARKHKEMEEPINAIKTMMTDVGAVVRNVKKTNRGYEVVWSSDGHNLTTLFDKNLKVSNAGYCVNGNDRILSPKSIVNVLKDGVREGQYIHYTLSTDSYFDDN